MDFVSIWKASSIVLTGAFGILGLLTEFKDKDTKKVTRWGRASLIGIIVTTLLGTAAQLKESHDDAAKARENSKKALEVAQNTQVTAQNTQVTLGEVRRLLTPVGDPLFRLTYQVPCQDDTYKDFCLHPAFLRKETEDQPTKWPVEIANDSESIRVAIFRDQKGAEQYIEEIKSHKNPASPGDASWESFFRIADLEQEYFVGEHDEVGAAAYVDSHPWKTAVPFPRFSSNGRIISTDDFDGTVMVLTEKGNVLSGLKLDLTSASLYFPNGQTAKSAADITRIDVPNSEDVLRINVVSLKVTRDLNPQISTVKIRKPQ